MELIAVILGLYIIGMLLYYAGKDSNKNSKKQFDKGYESGHIDGIREGYDMCKSKYDKLLSEIRKDNENK